MVYRYRTFKRLEHFFFISLKRKMCQIFFFFLGSQIRPEEHAEMRQKPSLKPGVSCLSWVWLLDNARARALLPPVSLGQQFPGHIQDPVQQGGALLAGLAHNLGSFSRMHRKPPVGRCQRIERAVHVEFRDQDRNRLDLLSQFRASGTYVCHFACTLLALCLYYTTLYYTIY